MTAESEVVEYYPAVMEHQAPVTLFRTDEPSEVVKRATATAEELAKVIRAKKLTVNISGREHVKVDGWCLLGTMLGVFPVCVWTRQMEDGWEARVEARTKTGDVVGAAEAQCLRNEANWRSRDDFALRSMAQTRATSKALRLPLGFVMTLAGYDSTPAEEMGAPAARRAAPAPSPEGKGSASEKQVGMIRALMKKLSDAGAIDADKFATAMQADYSVSSATELSRKEASSVIEKLQILEKTLEGTAE